MCGTPIAALPPTSPDRSFVGVVLIETVTALSQQANRRARNKIITLAQAREIDAILLTELSRWGRSTQDLLETLDQLVGWKVSVVVMSGMTFELDTPHGRMMATTLAGIARFERDLLNERIKSGPLPVRLVRNSADNRFSVQSQTSSRRKAPRPLPMVGPTAGSPETSGFRKTPSRKS